MIQFTQFDAVDAQATAVGHETQNGIDQAGFACAAWADQCGRLLAIERKGQWADKAFAFWAEHFQIARNNFDALHLRQSL